MAKFSASGAGLEAGEGLRASKAENDSYRLLIESITDYAIYRLGPTGIVASWNPGAQRLKGYSAEQIIGEHFSCFYTDEDRLAGVPTEGLETARREGRWEREGQRVCQDGKVFWAHVVIDAIHGPEGQVIGFAKVTRDITERKRAQAELEKARAALYQSQKMEAIGQITGGVAHDFNNLLMVALASLELLQKRIAPDPRHLSLIENAKQALQHGSALTERMLAFARRQELTLRATPIQTLLRNTHGFLQRSLGPTLRIDIDIPPDLPPALTDPSQMESALLNLAINARDAMSGSGAIAISGRLATVDENDPRLGPGRYVVISVTDTGEGMDAQTLARAAEPFFTTKDVGKGTGLGLSMVHGLAAQSGGALILESRPGEGTTAEIWLPAAAETESPAEAEAPRADVAPSPQFVVMLVDDDRLVLANSAALLEDLGHFVITAASGREALAAMKLHPRVDIVVTDYAMPQMNGMELAAAIRDQRPALPIILASGYCDLAGHTSPDIPRLRKPFTQEQIQGALLEAAESLRP